MTEEKKEEPDYGEHHDPTWQELAESYIKEHGEKIKTLDARVADLEGRKEEKEPMPEPEKEASVTMSLRSWNSFDRGLHMAEHYLVGALARVRNVRVNISSAMGKKLVDQAKGNLAKTMELGERMEEHGKELERLAKGTKDKDAKEA